MRLHRQFVPSLLAAVIAAALVAGCGGGDEEERAAEPEQKAQPSGGSARTVDASDIRLPEGYRVEAVARGLSYATSVAFDDEGNMYVAEAGGHTYGTKPEEAPPPRILRYRNGGGEPEVVTDEAPSLAAIRKADAEDLPPGLIAPITG